MRTRLVNLLLAALLALAGMRLWTSLGQPPAQLPPAPAPEGSRSAEPGGAAGPGRSAGRAEEEPGEVAGGSGAEGAPAAGQVGAAPAEGYDVIVARDLFSAARGVVPPAPPPAAKPAPKPMPQPKLTLSGVVILDGERSAFLQEATQPDARPKKVREGEVFAGGTVKAIRPDGITFLFGGAEVAVPLRTPKDAGPAPRGPEPAQLPQPGVVQRRVPPAGVQPGVQTGAPGRRTVRPVVPAGEPGFGQHEVPPEVEDEDLGDDDLYLDDGGDDFGEDELLDEENFDGEEIE